MRAFLFIVCCLALSSCFDKGDCLFANTNVVKVNLMDLDTLSRTHPIYLDTLFWDKYKTGVDTIVTALGLPVNPELTETTFILKHHTRTRTFYDTLVLGYTNQSIVLSPDCGAALFQDNLEIKYSTFDSVRIVNPRPLTSVKVNIEIRL